jgi:hypothetical protein
MDGGDSSVPRESLIDAETVHQPKHAVDQPADADVIDADADADAVGQQTVDAEFGGGTARLSPVPYIPARIPSLSSAPANHLIAEDPAGSLSVDMMDYPTPLHSPREELPSKPAAPRLIHSPTSPSSLASPRLLTILSAGTPYAPLPPVLINRAVATTSPPTDSLPSNVARERLEDTNLLGYAACPREEEKEEEEAAEEAQGEQEEEGEGEEEMEEEEEMERTGRYSREERELVRFSYPIVGFQCTFCFELCRHLLSTIYPPHTPHTPHTPRLFSLPILACIYPSIHPSIHPSI